MNVDLYYFLCQQLLIHPSLLQYFQKSLIELLLSQSSSVYALS